MASSPYAPVSWGEEPINMDKMNQMANNDQWLFENSPRMYYNAFGLKKSAGVKVLAGTGIIPATQGVLSSTTIYFGTFFSQGCLPIVVTSPVKNTQRTRFYAMVSGIGQVNPDHRGCILWVTTDERTSAANSHAYNLPIGYIAVGW